MAGLDTEVEHQARWSPNRLNISPGQRRCYCHPFLSKTRVAQRCRILTGFASSRSKSLRVSTGLHFAAFTKHNGHCPQADELAATHSKLTKLVMSTRLFCCTARPTRKESVNFKLFRCLLAVALPVSGLEACVRHLIPIVAAVAQPIEVEAM